MMPLFRPLLAAIFASLLAGCALQSDYHTPAVALPARWQGPAVTGTRVATGSPWWHAFNDVELSRLIEQALRRNNDLAAAALRVQRARLQAGLAQTDLRPTVTVGAQSSVSRPLDQGASTVSHTLNSALSYELDLWGRLASTRDAARWEAEASEQDRQSAALALIGTTAMAYWQIGYLNQRITAAEASLAYSQRTLALVRLRYRAGAVAGLEPLQAEQDLASQQASLSALRQQRVEARNALAILFDQPPEQREIEPQRLPEGPLPAIEPNLPASLLGQRPDLRAAELRLRQSLAQGDATRASFYPAFSLTGSVGSSSDSLARVLQNPVATLGAGLTLPFVQWPSTQLSIHVSENEYAEAVVNFRQSLYTALAEVENRLFAEQHYQLQVEQLAKALELAQRSELRAEARYRAGATDVQSWLDEQEKRRSAESSLAQTRLARLNNLMSLYQALGGAA